MSNGEQCCALEICCGGAERRLKTAQALGTAMGGDATIGTKVLDWMDANNLVFAPASFQQVIADVASIARAHPAE